MSELIRHKKKAANPTRMRDVGSTREKKSDPNGTRTRVAGVKGRSPRPLDDGAKITARGDRKSLFKERYGYESSRGTLRQFRTRKNRVFGDGNEERWG